MSAKQGKLLYHLTRLDNMESIIKNGLMPRAEKMAECLFKGTIPAEAFQSIAISCKADLEIVREILDENGIEYPSPYLDTRPEWFTV